MLKLKVEEDRDKQGRERKSTKIQGQSIYHEFSGF